MLVDFFIIILWSDLILFVFVEDSYSKNMTAGLVSQDVKDHPFDNFLAYGHLNVKFMDLNPSFNAWTLEFAFST